MRLKSKLISRFVKNPASVSPKVLVGSTTSPSVGDSLAFGDGMTRTISDLFDAASPVTVDSPRGNATESFENGLSETERPRNDHFDVATFYSNISQNSLPQFFAFEDWWRSEGRAEATRDTFRPDQDGRHS
jgi:hypothetical protein